MVDVKTTILPLEGVLSIESYRIMTLYAPVTEESQ
jgi:hypothetical protein